MKITQMVSAVVLGCACFVTSLDAQSRGSKAPAEFPPSTFSGNQYVDSRGCVFIRAGIDGNTTWIPRLTRKRQHICNAQPSRVAGTSSAPAGSGERVVRITNDTPPPAAAPVQTRRAAAQPRVASVAPAVIQPRVRTAPAARRPAPVVRAAVPVVRRPAPVAVAPQPVLVQRPAPAVQQAAASCRGASAISQRYINTSRKGVVVRCGPQAASVAGGTGTRVAPASVASAQTFTISPSAPIRIRAPGLDSSASSLAISLRRKNADLGRSVPSTALPRSTRVVPVHVARARNNTEAPVLPEGYRRVWSDDRLNPHRAEGTLEGRDNMLLVWTNTVPRRLIERRSGRDVTSQVALVYPYTDIGNQRSELGEVTIITRNGQTMKRIVRKAGAPSAAERNRRAPTATIATRSAAPKAAALVRAKPKASVKKPQAGAARYVQVAAFGQPANAKATAQRLAGLGLPIRLGTLTRGGKSYRLVLAGPFSDDASARSALSRVRSAGYADAYVR